MAGSCVRVDPPFVEFKNMEVGVVYKTTITVINVGKTVKKITFEKPSLKLFRFISCSREASLAAGLSVSGLLEFRPEAEEEVRDCIHIHIDDGETVQVPVFGFPRTCCLFMDPLLDFGCITASSQVISKKHPITNQGSAPGVFQVEYSGGDSSLQLSPSSGVVAAGATEWLKVELRTDRPRHLQEEVLVKLQNCSAVVLRVTAEVVDPCLEIVDLKGTPLSCLWFGPVYFGTSSVQEVVVRNSAPQACDWVCFVQEDAAGTEMGADLQRSTDAALLEGMKKCSPGLKDVSQVLFCVPRQGRLGPYEKTSVAVCFSPVWKREKRDYSSSRQDFCLFLLFDSVERKHGFTHRNANSSVELAVTGSGIPVSLVPSPSRRFDFLSCVTGQRVDVLCVLQNLCPQLPVSFRFRKLAHFSAKPSAATLGPGQCQDVVLTFSAQQQGSFRVRQRVDVLGSVASRRDVAEDSADLDVCSFHTITLHFSASCHSKTMHPRPAVKSPTRFHPRIGCSDLARYRGMVHAAVLSADKTQLHKHRREKSQNSDEEFLVFPDDRASSVRPASSPRQYRTIFTGVPRYRYVDTDYAFTEEEEKQRQQHRQIYADFIGHLRQTRLQRIKDRHKERLDDLDIVPCQGLLPPPLSIRDLERSENSEMKLNYSNVPLEAKSSCPHDKASISLNDSSQVGLKVSVAMNVVPLTSQEEADCNRTLTPQELYQVEISPLFIDFGSVCVQSVCVRVLKLINRLSAFVWLQLEVDCPELQGSSPLSYVLPPRSHTSLPLTFQSNRTGSFSRSLSYSVNQQHPGQILVQAQVIPLSLEMSTNQLVLHPTPSMLAASGYRSSVTLRNQCNHAAEFTWRPVVTESGILFSVRPAAGTVLPYKELDCEVVWHPSFSAPAEGDFDLCVREGNIQRLHCVAEVGATTVQLAEKRIMFVSVPLNLASVRTAVLHNTGRNHAYYQIVDVYPLPGMVLSPSEGVVPSKGQVKLKIHFNPDSVIKFDTKIKIALRNMKSIQLRLGGSVEPPNISIGVSCFRFCGVHVGSQRALPFTLTNHSPAAAQVTLDLSQYKDFSIQLPLPSVDKKPGLSVVKVQGFKTEECSLVFSPTQVSSYEFDLPLIVNGVKCSSSLLPTPSSSSADSRKHITPLSDSVAMTAQRSPRIQATALSPPLEMSPPSLQFHVDPQSDTYTQKVQLKAEYKESVCWLGVKEETVRWWFDCSPAAESTQDRRGQQLCAVCPSSGSLGPGQSIWLVVSINAEVIRTGTQKVTRLSLPLYLGGKERHEDQQPYGRLSVSITLELPSITIHPHQILLTPVPLNISIETPLTLLAVGYPSGTHVSAEVEKVEMEDGRKIQPISVVFPEGNTIPPQDHQQQDTRVTSLLCNVSFCSAVPLSVCTTITFTDHLHNRFEVKLCAVADNCLLTVWPYMALHHSDQHVILQTGATAVEANLQRYHTPSPASGLSTSSSSFGLNSSIIKNSDSFADSDSVSEQASRDTFVSPSKDRSANLSVPEFPAATTEEGQYSQSVLLAVERWFSLFGWPTGPHPITVPHTLRRVESEIQTTQSNGRTYGVSQNKDTRSVVEMLHHLTGRQIPGIRLCPAFSRDITQRTHQLLHQHQAVLSFLRVQGAHLCHIRPEYLLDVLEFKHWCSLQSNDSDPGLDDTRLDYESLSQRSWTDVLLQIFKVLVLCRVSERHPSPALSLKDIEGLVLEGSRSLASNVYSSWELQLLSWLNMNYQSMRRTVWGTDGAPSSRWIVNFDLDLTDGLVLAALLAAYCPYLIRSHFQRMYTTTNSLEQILHNNIIVVQALTELRLNIDVQPTDLSDPNPVQMLVLCVHLYEMLPQYLPVHTVTLSGGLHSSSSKQVRLKNPACKPIRYQVFLLGEDARFFCLPGGSTVIIPPKSNTEVSVQFSCSFLRPIEAVLLLISSSAVGLRCTTLTFTLKTNISRITPTKTVRCDSPCYQPKVIHVPLTNIFNQDAHFRVVLVESTCNPLEPKSSQDNLLQQAASDSNIRKASDEMEGEQKITNKYYADGSEFLSKARSVCLKSGQADSLSILYLPFFPGSRYCAVLLVSPQVGDMVYVIKATSRLPLPSPLTAKPSHNTVSVHASSVCKSVVTLHCKVGEVCEVMLQVPQINMQWEEALAIWGQHRMDADEHSRRMLTKTLHSSSVRTAAATHKFFTHTLLRNLHQSKGIEYNVELSLPQYFTLPSTVRIPVNEDTKVPWETPAGRGSVDVPLRFQADSVGQFTCEVILRSCWDTRMYLLEALVTSQEGSISLDFSSPAHRPVTQHIPLQNESQQTWKMRAEVFGEGFSGPDVFTVPAGTREDYPLTFHPAVPCVVMGRLSLYNDCDSRELVFTLRGVGEPPLPVDHLVLRCPVGKTTSTQLHVPNHSPNKVTVRAVTDLSVLSGIPSLEIKPRHSAPCTLAVSPWKRGKHTGSVSFVETAVREQADKDKGNVFGRYEVNFSLEIICEPPAPIKVIDVPCTTESSVAIEIPVNNPGEELLMLDVRLEGDELTGASRVSVPPRGTLVYRATFSPVRVEKSTGSVVFQSELVGEFWYQLELYGLPPPVMTLPQACCQLGKWIHLDVPLVNSTAETLELTVTNTNPRNYTLEMDSANTLMLDPRSFIHLRVRFSPSAIGEENQQGKITFTSSQLQECCVLLSGRGLAPAMEEPLHISSMIGSSSSIVIPFTNPTEHTASLCITLKDEDPSGAPPCHPVPNERSFSIPLNQTDDVQIGEGETIHVPVGFTPKSMKQQQVWLCITMKTTSSPLTSRSEEERQSIRWIYPFCGTPSSAPRLDQDEHQQEKPVDVGLIPGSRDKQPGKKNQSSESG
ncbi:cilia- and flagella-associated protein 47-like [Melanotaenia boesemani]|uniref:cilia- and flagella-associated protein 47-like n=1 Tax=Melanotaenia boesemani TaxID=1250792 RepID=UPI001C046B94|nr:cilia- and flagella-associated protein 47-like [Melanotaenia boesemani]